MAGKRDSKMDFILNEMESFDNGIRFSEICKLMNNHFPEMTQGPFMDLSGIYINNMLIK